MARALALFQRTPNSVIVLLGNRREIDYVRGLALKSGLRPSQLVLDDRSNTTIDNAYYAKQICRKLDLMPGIIVTSQYQATRAALTFGWVFGPGYQLTSSSTTSAAPTTRLLRETILRFTTLLFPLFKKGDDERLKSYSNLAWKLMSS